MDFLFKAILSNMSESSNSPQAHFLLIKGMIHPVSALPNPFPQEKQTQKTTKKQNSLTDNYLSMIWGNIMLYMLHNHEIKVIFDYKDPRTPLKQVADQNIKSDVAQNKIIGGE